MGRERRPRHALLCGIAWLSVPARIARWAARKPWYNCDGVDAGWNYSMMT